MAEYWKSTPSYWCKFCSIYVRDTGIERRNHEASGKHQNNIQRSLRELHKGQAREQREKQRAKDEVARLNELVGGKSASVTTSSNATLKAAAAAGPKPSSEQQRKAHAEQLASMGIELPEDLKKELSVAGSWQVVSERAIAPQENAGGWSLADIKKEADENKEDVKISVDGVATGVHKRKAEDDDDDELRDAESQPKRKAWGSNFKTYPGGKGGEHDEDLDALLSGVSKKPEPEVKKETKEGTEAVKTEVGEGESSLAAIPPIDAPTATQGGSTTVLFKKRKGKR